MTDWDGIAGQISEAIGEPFSPHIPRAIGGGCINTAVHLADERHSFFVKINAAGYRLMFEAELEGLRELAASRTIRVPEPLVCGVVCEQAFLAMEYVEPGPARRGGAASAGQKLALMHRSLGERFGWFRDNTIGATPQPNGAKENWVDFWRDNRLGYQLGLAGENGYRGRLQPRGERLVERFPALMEHDPRPSLLHGDLWGGNLFYDRTGEPVIYDPAVYYGDREADLAMTELFGGFGGDFYAAYRETWPLDLGYPVRKTLYNLYHILNHLNLFGPGYLGQAESMIERLLAEIG